MRLFALAVLLSCAPAHAQYSDAPTIHPTEPSLTEKLYARCPSNVPPLEPLPGGYFLPAARAERISCRLAACEAYAQAKADESAPTWVLVTLAALAGVGAGFGVGYWVTR